MLRIFWRKPTLMECAIQIADYFSMLPVIKQVALTGSLARLNERSKAHDIDLVLFHDGEVPDRMITLEGKVESWNPYGIDRVPNRELFSFLEKLFGASALPIARYLINVVPSKVDIVLAHRRILTDCDYLGKFSVMDKDPDFSKRVFCELPLLGFNVLTGTFSEALRHRRVYCGCYPAHRWEFVRQERKSRTA